MFPRLILLLSLIAGLPGCATQSTSGRGRLANVHTVAVNHAPAPRRAESSGGRVAGIVARHGVGYALGFAGLGFVSDLVGIATEVAGPSGGDDGAGPALQLLNDSRTDPLQLVAQRTERRIAARRLFTLTERNPDAVFDFQLRRANLARLQRASAVRPRGVRRARRRGGAAVVGGIAPLNGRR